VRAALADPDDVFGQPGGSSHWINTGCRDHEPGNVPTQPRADAPCFVRTLLDDLAEKKSKISHRPRCALLSREAINGFGAFEA